uniref:Uncharacterized protein n=1 Tax=Glossina pallidipes TaxID=7398 RepID=A0A1B0AFP8_GLOPL
MDMERSMQNVSLTLPPIRTFMHSKKTTIINAKLELNSLEIDDDGELDDICEVKRNQKVNDTVAYFRDSSRQYVVQLVTITHVEDMHLLSPQRVTLKYLHINSFTFIFNNNKA